MSEVRGGITLIAPHTAPLAWGGTLNDTLTAAGQTYQVTHVRVGRYKGEPYTVHAGLEEVR